MHITLVTTLMRLGALRDALDRVRARASSTRHAVDADTTALAQMRLQRLILILNQRLATLLPRLNASDRGRTKGRLAIAFGQPAFAAVPVRRIRTGS